MELPSRRAACRYVPDRERQQRGKPGPVLLLISPGDAFPPRRVLVYDLYSADAFWLSLFLAPVYMSGIWVGSRYFKGVSETVFRRIVVALVLIMGVLRSQSSPPSSAVTLYRKVREPNAAQPYKGDSMHIASYIGLASVHDLCRIGHLARHRRLIGPPPFVGLGALAGTRRLVPDGPHERTLLAASVFAASRTKLRTSLLRAVDGPRRQYAFASGFNRRRDRQSAGPGAVGY